MATPTCGYYVDASDLTVIFKGYISGSKQPDSGFKSANYGGEDISQLFQIATSPAEQIAYNTNYLSTSLGGSDLKNYFMDIDYVFPVITPIGYTSFYTFTANSVTYQAAIFDGFSAANNSFINGSITVANAPSGYTINYLLVGGGGGAGSGSAEASQAGSINLPGGGGGGGAGDIKCSSSNLTTGSYNISVSGKVDGGEANPSNNGNTGGTTTFSSFSSAGGSNGGGAGNTGTGGGPGNGNGTGYSTGNGGGGAYGYVQTGLNEGETYDGAGGNPVQNLNITTNVMTVNNGTVTFYNSSNNQITYNIGGGGAGGSSSATLVSGGSNAGGSGGNMPNGTPGGSGNGFDGGYGGGGGGGGAQDNAPPYGAGNGGRGGPGLAIIWWQVPQ